jgi:general secretion pathway protein M
MNLTLLRQRWDLLAGRERALVAGAFWLVAAALLWWLALAPALETLGKAKAQHTALDAQLQRMLGLKAEAALLQTQVRAGAGDARAALEASLKPAFGAAASLQVAGDRATLTLKGVNANALASWLVDLRANARLLPAEVRLTRPAAASAPDVWDASLVLNLPAR